MMDPSTLFNSASLSIHIPPQPLEAGPPSTSKTTSTLESSKEVDKWVTSLCNLEEREDAYYDESLPFYLILKLPPVLTKSQAIEFLIPDSTSNSPHLSLSADLAFVDGPNPNSSASSKTIFNPNVQKRDSFISSFNLDLSEGSFTSPRSSFSTTDYSKPIPLPPVSPSTPSPLPGTRLEDIGYDDLGKAVHLWSYVFGEDSIQKKFSSGFGAGIVGVNSRGKGKSNDNDKGRVWIGREGGEEGRGGWIGVWEFKGVVSYCKSNLIEPRLCVTVTITFRDDPKLEELLESLSLDSNSNKVNLVPAEEDEYMVESFDDVNLLEGLSETINVHLPASRLPRLTSVNSSLPPLPSQRPSFSSHRRSISLSTNSDIPLYPAIRRAFRRVLTLRSPLNVSMNSLNCPTPRIRGEAGLASGLGLDENEGEGMIMCVEIEGIDEGEARGFIIEDIEIEVTGGNGRGGDIVVKVIEAPEGEGAAIKFPIILRSRDQYNLLYAVSYTGQDETTAFDNITSSTTSSSTLYVSTPPSQRFGFKLTDGRIGDLVDSTPDQLQKERETMWMRNVAIIIKGKPAQFPISKSSEPRNLLDGYDISDSTTSTPSPPPSNLPLYTSPTQSFISRWNCNLDISSFTNKSQSSSTTFTPLKSLPQTGIPLSILASAAVSSTPAERRSKIVQPLEAIAGSKRHTISSLASTSTTNLALASPITNSGRIADTSRALPTPPPSETNTTTATSPSTSTAASVGRRFFSLPSSSNSTPPPPPPPSTASVSPINTNSLPLLPARTDTPPPRPTSANSMNDTRRNSSFSQSSVSGSPKITKRESLAVPSANPISISIPSNSNVGLGYPSSSSNFLTDHSKQIPIEPYLGDILISVILIPPHPYQSTTSSEAPTITATDTLIKSTDLHGEKGYRTHRIKLQDIFTIEVFILNRSETVKRFTIGYIADEIEESARVNAGGKEATILALENNVRIGPLAPRTCQSVRLSFLAIKAGAHTQDLRLIDTSNGLETRLREAVSVVVE